MVFLNDETHYYPLVALMVAGKPQNIAPSAVSGEITANEVIIALAEKCGIFPESIRDDINRSAI